MGRSVRATGEDFLFGGPTFALEESAGEPAGRSRLFPEIHGEREEFLSFPGLAGSDRRDQHDGFAKLHGH